MNVPAVAPGLSKNPFVPRTCVVLTGDEEGGTSKGTQVLLDIVLLIRDVTGLVVLGSWVVRDGAESAVEIDWADELLPNGTIAFESVVVAWVGVIIETRMSLII